MRQYFGTDGVRGVANAELSPELAFAIGLALGEDLGRKGSRPEVLIGQDGRLSGDLLEAAVGAGLMATGADVLELGVLPTPAVAWATKAHGASAGVMISASHNPVEDNGIKIFGPDGFKLSDREEERLEAAIRGPGAPRPLGPGVGRRRAAGALRQAYVRHLGELGCPLTRRQVVVDCAWGAAAPVARQVLAATGAQVTLLHGRPDGRRINVRCGSTDLSSLARAVRARGQGSIGIAFDGDADRALAVDEHGEAVSGDHLIGMFAPWFRRHGWLKRDGVALTVLANGALRAMLAERGVRVAETAVGDRYLLESLRQTGYRLAGEPSGHLLALDFSTTGDGLLTAVLLLWLLGETGQSLAEAKACFEPYPHLEAARPVGDKARLAKDPRLLSAQEAEQARLGPSGRVSIRPSGTEPLIRVMVEGPDLAICAAIRDNLMALIGRLDREGG